MGRVLVTGATGKTGRRLLTLLDQRSVPAMAACREPPTGGIRFDWTDRTTWDAVLDGVSATYLVAPMGASDAVSLMTEFIEMAIDRGVARFVLLSASSLDAGGPAMGQVHQWLQASGVEWAVLRPSWFMENFSEGPHCATTVSYTHLDVYKRQLQTCRVGPPTIRDEWPLDSFDGNRNSLSPLYTFLSFRLFLRDQVIANLIFPLEPS